MSFPSTSREDVVRSEGSPEVIQTDGYTVYSKIARAIMRNGRNFNGGNSRWLGDILGQIGYQEALDIAEAASNTPYDGSIILIWHPESHRGRWRRDTGESCESSEGEESEKTRQEEEFGHLHIFHTCPFRASYCRCKFLFGRKLKRRHGRRATFSRDLTKKYIFNWLFYFLQDPRRIIYFEVGKVSYMDKIDQIRHLRRPEGVEEDSGNDSVEEGFLSKHLAGRRQRDVETNQATEDEGNRKRPKVPGTGFRPSPALRQRIVNNDMLVSAIQSFMCVPLSSTCELTEWMKDEYLAYYGKRDNDYQRAVDHVTRTTMYHTCDEIWKLINEGTRLPVWHARTPNHYLSDTKSLALVKSVLRNQYETVDEVRKFVQRLFDICERKDPKKNTMSIVGPPNCGKSWFFDLVCAFYVNVGHIPNFTRGDHFPLNDCVGRRIIYWNEPNIMPSAYDTLKMLWGGDPCPANVKYQGHSLINRTPVIMTGNRNVIPHRPEFDTRVYRENWKQSPMLKGVKGYPSPKTLYHLYQMFDLV